jgi:hypothetical protein
MSAPVTPYVKFAAILAERPFTAIAIHYGQSGLADTAPHRAFYHYHAPNLLLAFTVRASYPPRGLH